MAAENTAFSSAGEEAITRSIDVEVDLTAQHLRSEEQFEDFYEIGSTARELVERGYKRVALQFPDELLHDSVPIFRKLKSRIGPEQELYVLADTSYGSCCVDEVAAQHVDADAMVHYGHACMSQTSRLPVIYVFGKKTIDVDDCISRLAGVFHSEITAEGVSKPVVLRNDVSYTHQAENILTKLNEILDPSVLYSRIPTRLYPGTPDPNLSQPVEDSTILYIGGESLGLTNLLMTHSTCNIISYDPLSKSCRLESSRTNKLLMRRYAVVQKARDADVFGILVGTLGVGSYLPLIKHIRALLARSHKKSYTVSVGKLNPSKLANFMEIECFVLIACPENSLVDAKDFFRPIVTPYELEVALQAEQSWTGRYVLDFEKLLADHAEHVSDEPPETGTDDQDDEDQPTFSLVTGTYRHAKRYGGKQQPSPDQTDATDPSALVLRNQEGTVAKLADNAAGQFLGTRSYQGLEMRIGEDVPSVLEQGRSGVARGYGDDHKG